MKALTEIETHVPITPYIELKAKIVYTLNVETFIEVKCIEACQSHGRLFEEEDVDWSMLQEMTREMFVQFRIARIQNPVKRSQWLKTGSLPIRIHVTESQLWDLESAAREDFVPSIIFT